MCIIAQQHGCVVLYLEVETPLHSLEGCHTAAQLLCRASAELCHSHGSNAVFDIDGHGLSQADIVDTLYRRHEVEAYLAIVYHDILGMEVALIQCIVVSSHSGLQALLHLQSTMNDECPAGLYE